MGPGVPPIETDLIALRSAMPDDAPSIAAICTGHLAGKGDFVRASLERRSVLVACHAARIAGAVIWDCEFFGRPFVWLLAVDPARRRAGIASMLMNAFEQRHSGQAILTSTNESNQGMQMLLARLGYRQSGRIDDLDEGDPELFYVKTARESCADPNAAFG